MTKLATLIDTIRRMWAPALATEKAQAKERGVDPDKVRGLFLKPRPDGKGYSARDVFRAAAVATGIDLPPEQDLLGAIGAEARQIWCKGSRGSYPLTVISLGDATVDVTEKMAKLAKLAGMSLTPTVPAPILAHPAPKAVTPKVRKHAKRSK